MLAQAGQLGADPARLVAQRLGRVTRVGEPVLRVGEIVLGQVAGGGDLAAAKGEMLGSLDRIQAGLGKQLREPLGLVHPVAAHRFVVCEQAADLGEPVPAVPGELDIEAAFA
jgi:hypothetical protein